MLFYFPKKQIVEGVPELLQNLRASIWNFEGCSKTSNINCRIKIYVKFNLSPLHVANMRGGKNKLFNEFYIMLRENIILYI